VRGESRFRAPRWINDVPLPRLSVSLLLFLQEGEEGERRSPEPEGVAVHRGSPKGRRAVPVITYAQDETVLP
jgi:hypothetical protein